MTSAANFNDYSGDGVFGRDRNQLTRVRNADPKEPYQLVSMDRPA